MMMSYRSSTKRLGQRPAHLFFAVDAPPKSNAKDIHVIYLHSVHRQLGWLPTVTQGWVCTETPFLESISGRCDIVAPHWQLIMSKQ
jgi:hypothetical protein